MQAMAGTMWALGAANRKPFVPSDIANLALWLKSDSITGLNDGDAVASWTDSSGNGRNAAQATPSLKPLYKSGIINGLPVVRFDADDVLAWTQFSVSNQTIFIVHKPAATITTTTTQGSLIANTTGDASRFAFGAVTSLVTDERLMWVCLNGGLSYGHAYAGGDIAAAWQILTLRFATNPAVSMRRNGADLSLINAAGRAFTATVYPPTYGQLGANVNGDYAEVVVYNSALSDSDRVKVEQYLAAKYAITLA